MKTPAFFALAIFCGIITLNQTIYQFLASYATSFGDTIPAIAAASGVVASAAMAGQAIGKVLVPLCIPGIIGTATYAFIGTWNEYLLAIVLTDSISAQTLTVGLARMFGEHTRDWNANMSLATMSSLPLVLLFIFFQRWVVKGMTAGAVK